MIVTHFLTIDIESLISARHDIGASIAKIDHKCVACQVEAAGQEEMRAGKNGSFKDDV